MEKSICGEFVTVVRHAACANNIHVTDYKEDLPNTILLMLDFNGLYAGIQESNMPIGGFTLLLDHEQSIFEEKLLKREVDFENDVGYWLEVDCHIPDDVARKTDDLPLALYVADNISGCYL